MKKTIRKSHFLYAFVSNTFTSRIYKPNKYTDNHDAELIDAQMNKYKSRELRECICLFLDIPRMRDLHETKYSKSRLFASASSREASRMTNLRFTSDDIL